MRCSIAFSLTALVASTVLGTAWVPASAATVTRVIGYGDPMPDRPDTVTAVGNPVLDKSSGDGRALVAIQSGPFGSAFTGLYFVDRANGCQRVISTETAKPGGGTMAISTSMRLTVHGEVVYFVEVDRTTFTTRLYRVGQPGGVPALIAGPGDAAPGGKLLLFTDAAAHAGGVLFEAMFQDAGGSTWVDVFNFDGSVISSGLLGKLRTPAPGTAGYQFWNENGVGVRTSGGEFVCLASAYASAAFPPNIQGIFGLPLPGSATAGRKIVDTLTTVPGFAPGPGTTFALPDLSQSLPGTAFDTDGSRTVFLGKTQGNAGHGIYTWNGTQLQLVADGTTPRPGTTDSFQFTGIRFNEAAVAISGSKIAFGARDVNGVSGIYLQEGSNLEPVVVEGQQVAGVDLFGVGLTRDGFRDDQILFSANSALWRAVLGAAPPASVPLLVERNGNAAQVRWDGTAAGAGAVLEETASLAPPDWRPVQAQSNPFPFTIGPGSRFFRLRQ